MKKVRYLAYGSNMLTERLQARCPSATPRGIARVDNYVLSFSKKSRDGSGKATLLPKTGEVAFGVIFDLNETELVKLDTAEGAGQGYDRIDSFSAHDEMSEGIVQVVTYLSDAASLESTLKPYDWYLCLVIVGARQHNLPQGYVDAIQSIRPTTDPKPGRKTRQEALRFLENCA